MRPSVRTAVCFSNGKGSVPAAFNVVQDIPIFFATRPNDSNQTKIKRYNYRMSK
jgi:hypothetical protein